MNLLDLEFLATGSQPYRYPLASGPEGATLEGRKMAMAGNSWVVKSRGSMPTVLNVTYFLHFFKGEGNGLTVSQPIRIPRQKPTREVDGNLPIDIRTASFFGIVQKCLHGEKTLHRWWRP